VRNSFSRSFLRRSSSAILKFLSFPGYPLPPPGRSFSPTRGVTLIFPPVFFVVLFLIAAERPRMFLSPLDPCFAVFVHLSAELFSRPRPPSDDLNACARAFPLCGFLFWWRIGVLRSVFDAGFHIDSLSLFLHLCPSVLGDRRCSVLFLFFFPCLVISACVRCVACSALDSFESCHLKWPSSSGSVTPKPWKSSSDPRLASSSLLSRLSFRNFASQRESLVPPQWCWSLSFPIRVFFFLY